jgi:hypothetical protein
MGSRAEKCRIPLEPVCRDDEKFVQPGINPYQGDGTYTNILRKVSTMKATDLRLGNIAAAIDEPGKFDSVLILEPGTVHLMNRTEADDENNIIGVPATRKNLAEFDIPVDVQFSVGGYEVLVEIQSESGHALVHSQGISRKIDYIHELQNLIHALCDEDIIKHPYVHQMNEVM